MYPRSSPLGTFREERGEAAVFAGKETRTY